MICCSLFEPFFIHQRSDILISVLVLVPPLLVVGELVRLRAWAVLAGTSLFLFTCRAMITSNARVRDAGSVSTSYWIS